MRKARLLVMMFLISLLSSCENMIFNPMRYYGENLHLLVASRESLLGVPGNYLDEVVVIDEDQYGRILYGFLGHTYLEGDEILAVGVVQTYNDQEVYYYDGINMISKPFNRPKEMEYLLVSDIQSEYSINDIETLKAVNDWGLPLKPENYFATVIKNRKPSPIKSTVLFRIYEAVDPALSYNECLFFSKDSSGLMLYVMRDYEEGVYGDAFLVMINQNSEIVPETGIYKLTAEQIDNPWEILYQFKVANGWAFH